MIYVMASVIAKPEPAAAEKTVLVERAATLRGEAGRLACELYERPEAPLLFQTVEPWQARADGDGPMKKPQAGPMLASPLTVHGFAKIS